MGILGASVQNVNPRRYRTNESEPPADLSFWKSFQMRHFILRDSLALDPLRTAELKIPTSKSLRKTAVIFGQPSGLLSGSGRFDMWSAPGYLNRHCPVCKSTEQQPYARKANHEVVKCADCRFVFTKSIPSERELFEHYLAQHSEHTHAQRRPRSISLRMKYWMLSQLLQCMSPAGSVIRTLELGCGEGLFLEIVQDNPRFHATGLDLCEKSIEKALTKVLDAHRSDLESKNFPDDTFDFVFAFHQLEHVQNPERLVLEMQRILKPGGYLFVALPCISHLTARLAGRRWRHLKPPEHLWYFSPRTLSKFVRRLGFEATFSSSLYPRAHLHLFARKCGDVDRTTIPRWMGHHADAESSDELTNAA